MQWHLLLVDAAEAADVAGLETAVDVEEAGEVAVDSATVVDAEVDAEAAEEAVELVVPGEVEAARGEEGVALAVPRVERKLIVLYREPLS